jgi:Ca-activated chloride channel family protein
MKVGQALSPANPATTAILLALTLSIPRLFAADSGVLLPVGTQQPDSAVFSLDEISIDVHIDNGDARISIRQIFGSHSGTINEGTYVFALPARGVVSDFAVWDGLVRIPGVILERRRAEEIYESLKSQAIDPGLLEQGERGEEDARRGSTFTAHIVPIPAFGTKRIEMEYHQSIAVENLRSAFVISLKPGAYRAQKAGVLHISFEMKSAQPLSGFTVTGKQFPLRLTENRPNLVRGEFDGRGVDLTDDFAAEWGLATSGTPLQVTAYRSLAEGGSGYFQAAALLAPLGAQREQRPRQVVALFDASLSMQWEKLERSFQALDALLHSLRPADRFNVLTFNGTAHACFNQPGPADAARIEEALGCVRAQDLRGGTNLDAALEAALAQNADAGFDPDRFDPDRFDPYVVLISDLGATEGPIRNGRIAAAYTERWKKLSVARRPRTYVFAVGDDANQSLARLLAENDGLSEWVRSTEPIEFKLNAFLSKIGRRPLDLTLTSTPAGNLDMVYALSDQFFTGSLAAWVGRYKQPGPATFSVTPPASPAVPSIPVTVTKVTPAVLPPVLVTLPAEASEHDQLPRTWAQARVDALLQKIEREGEDRASIDEIIRLSRKYKFVTPYTSFLAAPRSLLRPRVIRPGDPVLRVHTDLAIVSVTALFPFGLTKSLRYLKEEDAWQTRFLAPTDMTDGTYTVRLILRDRQGRVYREAKSFVIASKAPVIRVQLTQTRVRAGASVHLRVQASASTRTLTARLYGAGPVWLHWNPVERANTGDIMVPAQLPPGTYALQVIAEDMAHNMGTQEVRLEVVP